MNDGIQESIRVFEEKKEFREVKKLTRESFREDQTQLNSRLSKIRGKFRKDSDVMDNDGSVETASMSTDSETSEEKTTVAAPDNVELTVDQEDTGSTVDEQPQVNGAVKQDETTQSQGQAVNGNSRAESMIDLRKTGGRLYSKNEKLTPGSSHWDKISLKGGRPLVHHTAENRGNYECISPVPFGAEVNQIPKDGNLSAFSVDELVTVLRYLNVPEGSVQRLRGSRVDGRRFGTLADTVLEDLDMINPVVRYFRDRSAVSRKVKPKFML